MRNSNLFLCLVCGTLLLSSCAGPSAVGSHWGEAQRGAAEAMAAAARDQEGRGIDGAGADAAYGNYTESLVTQPEENSRVLLDIGEDR